MDNNNNNEFDYKRAGSRLLGAGAGVAASETMFRNTARGANLAKHKYVRPFVGAYSALQGQFIGNRAYNLNKGNPQVKQAEFKAPPPQMYQQPLYSEDPNMPKENPAQVPNTVMGIGARVGGTVTGLAAGGLAARAINKSGRNGLLGLGAQVALPFIGSYMGYKASDISDAPNAYTLRPNI